MMSIQEIRQCFPALARTYNGYPVAYFDGPGGTQVPRTVVEAMNDYLYHHNANTHWAYPTSEETDSIIDSARSVLADFLNARPIEIVFGANMTTLTFHLARALGRGYKADDEILVTELDHHANIAPWRTLEKECGVKVRMVKMIPETGELDWDDFSRQLTGHTKLVAAPDSAPERAETGTQNHEGIAGAAAAVDFLASLAPGTTRRKRLRAALRRLHECGDVLTTRLWRLLGEIRRVRLYGPSPEKPRTPTIAFTVNGMSSIEVAEKLAERGVFLSHGDFYAMTVVERLGQRPHGLVRAGCACYTTPEEVDRLIASLCGLST